MGIPFIPESGAIRGFALARRQSLGSSMHEFLFAAPRPPCFRTRHIRRRSRRSVIKPGELLRSLRLAVRAILTGFSLVILAGSP